MRINFITNCAGHTGFRDYIQTSFVINHNCADYAGVHDNMKNNFITDYADYASFIYYIKIIISPVTTRTMLILETTSKRIWPVNTLATQFLETT